jgi:plasmid rolling circle replication initiator protein Rep
VSTKSSLQTGAPSVNALGASFLSDFSERDAKWDSHRSNTQSVGTLYGETAKYSRLANRMRACATSLAFAWSQPDPQGETRLKLKSAKFCKVRHCPVCQWRRAMRNVRKVFERLPALEAENPKLRWLFLTLTVKNPEMADLRSTLVAMNLAWNRFIQRKEWPAVGWLRAVEVTRGGDGKPHPHFHVMLCVKPSYFKKHYLSQQTWLQLWRDCMRDQTITQVDVRVVKPKEQGGNLSAAVVETLKYSFKPEDVMQDAEFLFGLTDQLHKMRFLASGGSLKGILKDSVSDAEMIAGDEASADPDQAAPILTFNWSPTVRKYARANRKN